jgi:Family of unknown function (DUF5330)
MFFLLRMAFWLGVVCILLPSGGNRQAAPQAQITAGQAVTLAGATLSDMRGFCERQPDACKVGGKVAVALGYRAEAGARTLFEFVTDRLSRKPTAAPVQSTAQRTTTASIVPVGSARRGTLTASDRTPAWHDPAPAPIPLPPRRMVRADRPSA